jgi:hypothetical protein
MNSFATWILRGISETQGKSRLMQISDLIDWSSIRRILDEMYYNKSEKGRRSNCDVILMFKIPNLPQCGLSDLEVERQTIDRISFMSLLVFQIHFLIPGRYGYSENAWQRLERWSRLGRTSKTAWCYGFEGQARDDTRMPLLSRQIQENQRKYLMELLRLATAEMGPGQKG